MNRTISIILIGLFSTQMAYNNRGDAFSSHGDPDATFTDFNGDIEKNTEKGLLLRSLSEGRPMRSSSRSMPVWGTATIEPYHMAVAVPGGVNTSQGPRHLAPELSFFKDCAFVCIDIQPMTDQPVEQIPQEWKDAGYTREDCQAANDFFFEQTLPNARKVADSCRALGMPMIFIHWGCLFADGMDLDPAVRRMWLKNGVIDPSQVPYIGHPDARPNPALGVRNEDYVLPKSAQDAFSSSNLGYVLENLGVKHIVFVGGHTNPGGCLGKTARSAREKGYSILCIEDATFDAGESTRKPGIASVPFDYVMTTRDFLHLSLMATGDENGKTGRHRFFHYSP